MLDGIDLEVSAGTTFSLLGPNGAGKTTAVQIMSTLVHADGGEVRVAGHDVARDPAAVRAAIGVTGQFSAVDSLLTGEENLLLMADLHHLGRAEGRRRAAALLDQFDLADAASKTAMTYSGGMRRRLDLAMTLIGDPRIIFLDEPTTGLDPRSRRMMWQTIRELVARGVTIFLTTQQLDEADQLADRIAVLDHGKVVAEGRPEELKRSIPGAHVRLHFADATGLVAAERALGDAFRHDDALTLEVPSDGGAIAVRELLNRLGDTAAEVDEVSVHTPDLDDVFFALTGRPAKETTPEMENAPMTTLTYAVQDSATMTRRSLRHVVRYPVTLVVSVAVPVLLLLLFVGVFGALKSSLGAGHGSYINYVMPGIIVMTAGVRRLGHRPVRQPGLHRGHHRPVPHHGDLTCLGAERVRRQRPGPHAGQRGPGDRHLDRARVPAHRGRLPMAGGSRCHRPARARAHLAGRPVRPGGQDRRGPDRLHPDRPAAAVHQQRVRAAGLMSGFVRWFAEHEPFTPVIDTIRGLLTGGPIGGSALAAILWCAGLALVGYLWSRVLLRRDLNR